MELVTLAYLEPGSGSIIAQTVLAMIFSIGFFLRRWIGIMLSPVTSLFRRSKPQASQVDETDSLDPAEAQDTPTENS